MTVIETEQENSPVLASQFAVVKAATALRLGFGVSGLLSRIAFDGVTTVVNAIKRIFVFFSGLPEQQNGTFLGGTEVGIVHKMYSVN
jgi:hypothetical protein